MREIVNKILSLDAKWRISVFILYLLFVTYLSLAPADAFRNVRLGIPYSDKIVHFMMYGFFVVVLRWAINGAYKIKWKYLWLLGLSIFYGILMEVLQWSFSPLISRSFEIGDIVANSLGASVFWIFTNGFFNKQIVSE
ncbi:MAG: VanZ family protein [Verrucomicrobiia bacterium]